MSYPFRSRTLRIVKAANDISFNDDLETEDADSSDDYVPETSSSSDNSSGNIAYNCTDIFNPNNDSDEILPISSIYCNSLDEKSISESFTYNSGPSKTRDDVQFQMMDCVVPDTQDNNTLLHDIDLGLNQSGEDSLKLNCIKLANAYHKTQTKISAINSTPSTRLPKKQYRKHTCKYCDIPVLNFSRHLKRLHSDEFEVQKFLSLNVNDPMRKQLIGKMRKEGDFCTGDVLPVMKTIQDDSNLLPCKYCKGYYSKKSLRRHIKRCSFNNSVASTRTYHQSQAQTVMSQYFGPNDPLRVSGILDSLKADDISLVAKRDKIICEVARKYIRSHREKHFLLVAKRYMRRLARILIEARKMEGNKTMTMLSLLHPSHFKTIVEATRLVAQYDVATKTFSSPSLALQMGTLLKKAISASYSLEIQRDVNSENIKVLDVMKNLIDDQWAIEVSSEAGQNLQINRFNKPTLIPAAEDIQKMKEYLDDLMAQNKTKLEVNQHNKSAFRILTEATYCSLLLFNKRRVGELQRIPIDIYLKHHNTQSSAEFEKLLTPSEKILIKSLKHIIVRGKRGRGVPVLFDKPTKEGIDLLVKVRENFIQEPNQYLFGLCGSSNNCISGYHVLRKHAKIALGDASKTSTLTSTRLRKHLATISQILRLQKEELEQLATFMGHTPKTHAEWYRLPSDIYQTAKVSKILLLAQKSSIDQYKGKNLEEINLDGNIIDNESSDSGEDEGELIENEENLRPSSPNESKKVHKSKGKRRLVPWSDAEKQAVETFFKRHIKNKIPPKKAELEELMSKNPNLFKSRNWATIKVYVQNRYRNMIKKY